MTSSTSASSGAWISTLNPGMSGVVCVGSVGVDSGVNVGPLVAVAGIAVGGASVGVVVARIDVPGASVGVVASGVVPQALIRMARMIRKNRHRQIIFAAFSVYRNKRGTPLG